MKDEKQYRAVGFIRSTPATAAAFAQVDECRAQLFASNPAPSVETRIALRAAIGKLTQEIRKVSQQGTKL